jgi:hypothetical protein
LIDTHLDHKQARRASLSLLVALWIVAGVNSCSTDRDPSSLFGPLETGMLVVDGLLVVGAHLPEIRLTRTGAPDRDYNAAAQGVSGAQVMVRQTGGATYTYAESSPGRYRIMSIHIVQSGREYTLEVITAQGERLTARTTTPPPLFVTEWVLLENDGTTVRQTLRRFAELGDMVFQAPENQLTYPQGLLEARFDRPDVLGFQLGLRGLDKNSPLVVPADFLSPEDRASLPRSVSSPIFEAEDGKARLPWFAVYYAGRHVYRVLALDLNTFDLIRSLPEQGGSAIAFGGNAGGDFQRPIFHIEGGIGLFGSAAIDSVGFNVLQP